MKIIQLPDVLHEYLVHLIEAHAAQGIRPEEGLALYQLWDFAVVRATTIPDSEMQKMAAAGAPGGQSPVPHVHSPSDPHPPGPCAECDPQTTESHQTGEQIAVECKACYDEFGSQACLRPAHQQFAEPMGQ